MAHLVVPGVEGALLERASKMDPTLLSSDSEYLVVVAASVGHTSAPDSIINIIEGFELS